MKLNSESSDDLPEDFPDWIEHIFLAFTIGLYFVLRDQAVISICYAEYVGGRGS